MDLTQAFEAERGRLVTIAARILGDWSDAEDVVQHAWLRLHRVDTQIDSLPAWLTTVTTRLCLDRLKARTPLLLDDLSEHEAGAEGFAVATVDPADHAVLADTVGIALQVVLNRLTPSERVAFVLHDTFGFDFATIAALLDTTAPAARKLASRARAKVAQPAVEDALADWQVVDAFMAAAREGDFVRLLAMLAPEVVVRADDAAVLVGTPARIDGRDAVAKFFNGAAHAALAVYVGDCPASAWFDRGEAKVLFDFTLVGGLVEQITFRADPTTLAQVVRRKGPDRRL